MRRGALNGQAIVETAIVIVILLTVVLGAFEYGRVMWVTNAVTSAAREGARLAAVTDDLAGNSGEVVQRARQILTDAQLSSAATVSISPLAPEQGDLVSVTVQMNYTPITGVMSLVGLNPVTIQRTITMRYEG